MYLGLLILTLVFYVVVIVVFLWSRAASWFHPLTTYLGFHGMVFVIRPWFAWYYDFESIYRVYQFMPDSYVKNMTLVVANLGLAAFAVASLHTGSMTWTKRWDAFSELERRELVRPFIVVCVVLAPLITYSLYTNWVDRIADDVSIEIDLSTGVSMNVASNGYVKTMQLMAVSLTALFAWLFRFRIWSFIPLAAFVFFRAGTGGRGPIISALICMVCLFLYERNRKWPDVRIVGILAVGLMLFNLVGHDRGRAVRDLFVPDSTTQRYDRVELKPLEGMDFGNLEMVEFLVHAVPRKTGTYEYFVDQLQVFTEPIPRQVWKNKPIGQPIRLFNLYDYGFPIGMTRSLPGEGWTQLGLVGVVLWCGLWGAVLGRVYSWWLSSGQSAIRTAAYAALFSMLIIFYRDGYPITLLREGLFILLPCALWPIVARLMATPRAADLREMAGLRLLLLRQKEQSPTSPSASASVGASEHTAPADFLPRSRRKQAAAMIPRAWRRKEGLPRP